jgi:5-methylcytosine-specific restriction endonuclease McrA
VNNLIVKLCKSCGNYFKSELLNHKPYCHSEKCQKVWNLVLKQIIHKRYITANFFDVYDDDFPIHLKNGDFYRYERVCRYCGARLLKKNGKHSYMRRQCKDHSSLFINAEFTWSYISSLYKHLLRVRNQTLIICKLIDEKGFNSLHNSLNITICELCNDLCSLSEVHHKKPVHRTNPNDYLLIWDLDNLINLCLKCHNKQDHQLRRSEEEKKKSKKELLEWKYRNFRKIDDFFV